VEQATRTTFKTLPENDDFAWSVACRITVYSWMGSPRRDGWTWGVWVGGIPKNDASTRGRNRLRVTIDGRV